MTVTGSGVRSNIYKYIYVHICIYVKNVYIYIQSPVDDIETGSPSSWDGQADDEEISSEVGRVVDF